MTLRRVRAKVMWSRRSGRWRWPCKRRRKRCGGLFHVGEPRGGGRNGRGPG
jgi:hypothetical protein